MLNGRRKSIQPMAERLPDGDMQALQQFVNQSPWDHAAMPRVVVLKTVPVVDSVVWVIDEVSFPKGRADVGRYRRAGVRALGKQSNCQVAVSLQAASDRLDHLVTDREGKTRHTAAHSGAAPMHRSRTAGSSWLDHASELRFCERVTRIELAL